MTFEEILDQAIAMLQRRGRVTYRLLKRQFQLDDDTLGDLLAELRYAHREAISEDEQGMVWTGAAAVLPTPPPPALQPFQPSVSQEAPAPQADGTPTTPQASDAERRQLTVLFCDLVDSTRLASELDPEDLRAVVRAYQEACAKVIARFDGHIAQYLGDGLLVYFGYPLAHEDDAQRAVRAGLGIIEAVGQLNTRLAREREVRLAVRLGIHTGLVVVGEVGSGTRQEQLALGETPNLAARLQGIAMPNTVVISAATFHLLGGFFACQPLGTSLLKGLSQPVEVYQVLQESMARSRLEAVGSAGLTPLVGREQEIRLLVERWAQVKEGVGQVVLLNGEGGIGKSRLVQVLQEHVATEPQAWLTPCQCSPYHQNTALYPMIELLERVALRFERDEVSQQKLHKLEGFLVQYGLPLAEAMPLFASLLSLPLPDTYAPLTLSPAQQKQLTLHALLTILLRIATQQPLLFVMEDLHWVDPTTIEFLTLVVDQGPTARILALWTFRPDFSPPWTGRSHLTQVTLPRLPRRQAAEMTDRVAHGKALPPEVVEQIVAKTDGVPLFVEELTKMVLESGLLQERDDRYALTGPLPPLAIPATLHDSLMARLDRLATVKGLAQLGATLGREFAYELLQAVSPWDEDTLRRGLSQLVAAEFLYQHGLPPHATYTFKHALIQDTAYQSLLRSTRQHYHQRIAQMLEERFADIVDTQPELLAQHFTEAGQSARAITYWQRAGERALQRSANLEAISHLTKGLEVLKTLPNSPERLQHELDLQITVGPALMAIKGPASEVEQVYMRARVLCTQVGETPQLFPVLWGLRELYTTRGELQTARELGEQGLALAQHQDDATLVLEAHAALAATLFYLGEFAAACSHAEQGLALYDPQEHRHLAYRGAGYDVGVLCLNHLSASLGYLGYADQALQKSREMVTLVQGLAHPLSLAAALSWTARFHQIRREPQVVYELAEAIIALATAQGFPQWLAQGIVLRGWALAEQGQAAEGVTEIRQGLAAWRATGAEIGRQWRLLLLAEAQGIMGQTAEGLATLAEALAVVERTGDRRDEAELHRLKGAFLLRQAVPAEPQAETCFRQALDVAHRQEAKALELRTAMSLSRLWQHQGKRAEAYELLAPI